MLPGLVAACVVLLGCGGGGLQPHFGFAAAGAEEETGGRDNRRGTTVEPQSRGHAKPAIAILGLEVYDNGAGVDRETVRAGLTAVHGHHATSR